MFGELISGGLKLLGGYLDNQSADKRNQLALEDKEKDRQLQKEFAQQGLSWKIADAMKNKDLVHPLYSIGGAGASYTPSAIFLSSGASMSDTLGSIGQDVGRAVNATRTADDRFDAKVKALQLERGELENAKLRSEIAKMGPSTPAMPIGARYLVDGQGESVVPSPSSSSVKASGGQLVTDKALERVPAAPGQPQSEPGAITDVGYARTATGWAPVPSKDVKERIEDNIIQEAMWAFRNNVMPTFGYNKAPPPFPAPEGKAWVYNPLRQEYRLQRIITDRYGKRPGGWYIR